ncbi:hypothetical protein COU15_02700 [Candidatus Kaiserbacteria bacterium CG10_big_fil_rev_8_21_14_0_10_45_20]|uniref:DNA polymerase III delta N-terminal domain-containing protein n=1 Tax=Candidatus Kaiserbacteria bacterium CG10_big_fil_rev_8_21_14_0_10_45_20 TaxID=1974607 RepID=A0A2H0UF70_9BACT|nr:MAG: hypothetical protein COU15_02700 [Candidatus Kaiserbacteria bacterium CG10_big_fil_rev_8_21_14_0_10_45_20]
MLYIFTGTDIGKAKARARELAKEYELVVFGEGGEPIEKALGVLASHGLFVSMPALLFDRVRESEEGKVFLEDYAQALHESKVPVFIVEPKLTATELKKFPSSAKKEFFGAEEITQPQPNVFAFTDAFLSGDRKRAWIQYRTLMLAGSSAEEIHGAMVWAVRSMLLSLKTSGPTEAGLKPFVYSKSKKFGEKIGIEKAETLSSSLISAYHRSRMGEGGLDLLLEDLLLAK